ncbi:1,4-alpha-glucan branching protein GlgB [Marinigracilibium pacificum]|uniref:1,4-alpha-glucan branching enzyme GlgB n=1 Tax=Marinigracilibium pacificum TaxID=2729599 RepID=A0A848J0U2_9BACT|nr:1,4-alpha-glucan branching protein GlgB [Marinigracilibium pacificum]NMM48170.1 1,4-alpha-glucan branching protein GlgB [Marinigracilibium pacificum]
MKNSHESPENKVQALSMLTDFDISLFNSGKHFKLYEKLGSRVTEHENKKGVYFAVWAPNASKVSVIGEFNGWAGDEHYLFPRWDSSGIWEGFIEGLDNGTLYKYKIQNSASGRILEKGDPFAFYWEVPPKTASIVWDNSYKWKDKKWMQKRIELNALDRPISVYEVHLGSWKRKFEEANRSFSYREMAEELVSYVKEMGFTHIEFMPVMEHPFFGSWGYQVTGYFAPSSRYGTPQDFMYLVEAFHNENIGVYLDWVPSHFPNDAHGLFEFDGTSLYEHEDPRQGYHPDWNSYIFNYGRNEVRSFLISNACYWLDVFHADGLRVDAVASMLYLDYSRNEGEWIPNKYGGRENLEAIDFMKEMNEAVYGNFEGVQTIAEESTSWPMVTKPTYLGGLGFGMKWMMGWMNDTLVYFGKDAIYRNHHQNNITFSMTYAFTENFMLPLSHDEVVHGKGSLLSRMPGDEWQKFANLRCLYGYMFTHPGTNLIFMGDEFGQSDEWKHDKSLDWWLEEHKYHSGIKELIKDLNKVYKSQPAMYEKQFSAEGFEWIDYTDSTNSVIVYMRKGHDPENTIFIAVNFTPVPREGYEIGVPFEGEFEEILNTDYERYGGSNMFNGGELKSVPGQQHGQKYKLKLSLSPLGVSILKMK